jgi:hypothetical protein
VEGCETWNLLDGTGWEADKKEDDFLFFSTLAIILIRLTEDWGGGTLKEYHGVMYTVIVRVRCSWFPWRERWRRKV